MALFSRMRPARSAVAQAQEPTQGVDATVHAKDGARDGGPANDGTPLAPFDQSEVVGEKESTE